MAQLRENHPSPQETSLGSLLFGPVEDVPDSIYQQINGKWYGMRLCEQNVRGVPQALMRMGSGELFLSKSFKKSVTDLCAAIAAMTRRLCTEFIDPLGIEAILANRLIPLDKVEGAVRQIGVG